MASFFQPKLGAKQISAKRTSNKDQTSETSMRSRSNSTSSARRLQQVFKVVIDSPLVQVENGGPETDHEEGVLRGRVAFDEGFLVSQNVVRVEVVVTGSLHINTHRLALGWSKGGAAVARSGSSRAAEPVDRKVFSKSVNISMKAIAANEAIFSIALPHQLPSTVQTEWYQIIYTAHARVFAVSGSLEGEHLSIPVPFAVASVRSRTPMLNSWEPSKGETHASGVSMDGFVSLRVERAFDEICLPTSAFSESFAKDLTHMPCSTDSFGWMDKAVELGVNVDLDEGVERILELTVDLRQRTTWRFVAFREEVSQVGVELRRENAKVDHLRKIGVPVSIHVPINTKTVVSEDYQKSRMLRQSVSCNTLSIITSELAHDSPAIFGSYNTFDVDCLELESPVHGLELPPDHEENGSNSKPSSPLKRKFSLPAVNSDSGASPDLSPATSQHGAAFKPLSFFKKLTSTRREPDHYAASTQPSVTMPILQSKLQPPLRPLQSRSLRANSNPSPLHYTTAFPVPIHGFVARNLRTDLNVSLAPKEKTDFLPATSLREVVRSHFFVIRVAYRVRKDKVAGTGLKTDRYVEVVMPVKVVQGRN
ncbi:hypothetical protein BC830DRAFT_1170512 [Chytriomyces sp. MP71]|nr:hypothetical protein BC830DRAFT_1170512 [Chytriomyces sp. MP71]